MSIELKIESKLKSIKDYLSRNRFRFITMPENVDVNIVYDILIGHVVLKEYATEMYYLFIGIYYELYWNSYIAKDWYLKSIGVGNVDAMVVYGLYCETRGSDVDAEDYYRMAFKNGSVSAGNFLGQLYVSKGFVDEAEKYLLLAIERGYLWSFNNYGWLCMMKKNDKVKAEKFYLMGVERGDVFAVENYGFLLEEMGDLVKAEEYYVKAVEMGGKYMIDKLIGLLNKKPKGLSLMGMYKKLYDKSLEVVFLEEAKSILIGINGEIILNAVRDVENVRKDGFMGGVVKEIEGELKKELKNPVQKIINPIKELNNPDECSENISGNDVVPFSSRLSLPGEIDDYEFL